MRNPRETGGSASDATTVSDRLKNLVLYALQARYDVEEATSGKWEQARLTVAPRALRALG